MDYENEGCLQVQFSKAAKLYPERIAIVDNNGREVSYKQLDRWTDLLAGYLRKEGLCENRCAIIFMERSLAYVIAYIAILKAGGAYLPLDISYPQQLIEDILTEAEPYAIITRSKLKGNIPSDYPNTVICLDDPEDLLRTKEDQQQQHSADGKIARSRLTSTTEPNESHGDITWEAWLEALDESGLISHNLPIDTGLDSLAFIVYSSGTTGKPKGIAVPHRAPVFSYLWRHIYYPYEIEPEREACNVFFVWEFLRPLLRGQTLHIIPDEVIYDPQRLLDFLKVRAITRMLFTPSLLEAVIEVNDSTLLAEAFQHMRQIWLCGEVVTTSLLDRCIKKLPKQVQLINLYSISECHDVAAANLNDYHAHVQDVKSQKFCPVGKLLPGVQILILNEHLEPQPVGVSGEIYVAGPTLARGYVKRPDLNKLKFLPVPEKSLSMLESSAGVNRTQDWPKMYRTGDWGYLLSDGSLEICGRCDSMVKIRGYSVEIQAVESMLMSLDSVHTCVVLAHGAEGDDKRLVAYIVPSNVTVTKKHIRAQLKRRLPFYMIPNYYVFLKEIPLLAASGKLDKKALPAVDPNDYSVELEFMPQTSTEIQLAGLWKEVLNLKEIDIQESFFDLGGHSLLATKLLNLINSQFSAQITVRDLFKFPTVSSIAKILEGRSQEGVLEANEDVVDLNAEAERHDQSQTVDMDIQLRAFWRFSRYNESRWFKGCALLTGATGFLGSFLLRDLLLQTHCQVFCLVRENDKEQDAKARIHTNLKQLDILPKNNNADATEQQQAIQTAFEQRVIVVSGDITLVRFGLAAEDYSYLCTEIDYIVHAAAYVNLVYPYAALYNANVLGTANILLFASHSKIKPVHFISTDAVFPHALKHCREDADMSLFPNQLTDGYSQTKWVAEQLVLRAMQRGQPVIIYRLGNQSGDRVQGAWNPADFTYLMIRSMLSSGCAPQLSQWSMEMTPVDFSSSLIVQLTQLVGRYAGKILHLTQPNLLPLPHFYEWLSQHGYPLKTMPFSEWLSKLAQSPLEHESRTHRLCMDMCNGNADYFTHLSTFEQHNVRSMLRDLNLTYPQIDTSLLTLYFSNLLQRKLIPAPVIPSSTNSMFSSATNLLKNRVAIVTGASSGIGQAVAIRLGALGCSVCVCARRREELEQTRLAIVAAGGNALLVTADVSKLEEMTELVKVVEIALGPVDIVVHSAGVMYYTLMKNVHVEQWNSMIDINCKGTTNVLGAVLSSFKQRPGARGHLIFISSDAGVVPFPGLAVYTGSKYFVQGVCKATRKELAADEEMKHIRITLVQPGDVRTPMQTMSLDKEAEELYSGMGKYKMLEAEDVASAVVFALNQPEYVAVNEILVEPREAPT